MRDYFASLRLLLDRADDVFLPGHGPPLPQPRELVREMLTHRMMREQAIAKRSGGGRGSSLMDTLYSQLHPRLRRAAERNVLAHLLKMESEGKVVRTASCGGRLRTCGEISASRWLLIWCDGVVPLAVEFVAVRC